MTDKRYTALVLAASRGNQDPLAQAGGVSHKCFIDIAGEPMLRRVVKAVADSGRVKRIIVQIEPESTEEAKAILAPLGLAAITTYTPSGSSIGTSVGAVAEAFPDALPLMITTGDNALHTGEMVKYFCDHLDDLKVDAGLGLTPARYVLEKYPEGNRAFHRFADGQFSSCNLYALLTPHGFEAAKVFNSGGQFGKKPKRLIGAFGLVAFLVYKSRLTKLNTFLRFLSGVLKVKTAPVVMPFAEGPIDVDRMVDWELANRIIAEREGTEVKKPGPAAAAAAPKAAPKPKAAAKKPVEPKPEPEVVAAAAKPKKAPAPKAEAAAPKPVKKAATAKAETPAKPAPAADKGAATKAETAAPAPEPQPAPAKPARKVAAAKPAKAAAPKAAKLAPPSTPVKTPVKKIAAPKATKGEPAAPAVEAPAPKPAPKAAAKKPAPVEAATEAPAAKLARKPPAKKAAAPVETVAEAPVAKPAPARKAPAKKAPAKAATAATPAAAKKPRVKPKTDKA